MSDLRVLPGGLSEPPITIGGMHISKQSIQDIADYATSQQAAGKPRSTVYLRTWQLRRFAEEYPGSIRAASTGDLARHLARDEWSPATKYSVRATFRSFYGFLATAGRIRRNPALDLPTIRRPHREPVAAPEEVVRVPCTDPRVQLMVDLGARQGLRRCEIVAVHSRDLRRDLLGWSLLVHGKGARERLVPLHEDIAARILAAGPGWLFPSPRSASGHLTASRAGTLIKEAMDGWPSHSLRRRFATKIENETHDIRSIQMLLGHSDLSTTQRYLGKSSGQLRTAVSYAA